MKLFWVRHRKYSIIFPIFDCLRFFFNVQKVYDLVLFEFFFQTKNINIKYIYSWFTDKKKKMVKNYKMLLQSKLIYTYLWNISKTRTSNQVLQFTQVNVFKFCDKHIHWHLLSIQLQRGDHLRYPCIAVKFFTVQSNLLLHCTNTNYIQLHQWQTNLFWNSWSAFTYKHVDFI